MEKLDTLYWSNPQNYCTMSIRKHNTPIDELLENFRNKKSCKVVKSRTEIRRRFPYLNYDKQLSFLEECTRSLNKSDSFFVCEELSKDWNPDFEANVISMWEQYHEIPAALCIIKNFPEEYILAYIGMLNNKENYYDLCLRMSHNLSFTIDRERLTPLQLLSIWVKAKCSVESGQQGCCQGTVSSLVEHCQ